MADWAGPGQKLMAGPGLRYWASAQCGPPPGPGSRTPGFTPGSFDPAHNFRRGLSQALARPPNMFRGGMRGIWSVSWGPQTGHPRRGRSKFNRARYRLLGPVGTWAGPRFCVRRGVVTFNRGVLRVSGPNK